MGVTVAEAQRRLLGSREGPAVPGVPVADVEPVVGSGAGFCGADDCNGSCAPPGWDGNTRALNPGARRFGCCPRCGSTGTAGMPCVRCTVIQASEAGVCVRFA